MKSIGRLPPAADGRPKLFNPLRTWAGLRVRHPGAVFELSNPGSAPARYPDRLWRPPDEPLSYG